MQPADSVATDVDRESGLAAPKPVAVVAGEPLRDVPEELYIPPDALEVILETFEGPLDLLLYLIRKQNLDILDIPIALVTDQYMEYISLMGDMRLELAGEYLLMAAILAEIKSRMLLPKPALDEDEEDPRAELVRRLQEYERLRVAAAEIEALPRLERDNFVSSPATEGLELPRPLPAVELPELLLAFATVMERAARYTHHKVSRERLSVRERMSSVLSALANDRHLEFTRLFEPREGRSGVIVTLLAVLELSRELLIELDQTEPFGPIYVRACQ